MIRRLVDQAFSSGKYYISAVGLSTDVKPTEGIITGSKFVEVDTGIGYLFDETAGEWHENTQLSEAVAAYLDEHPEAVDQAAIEALFADQLDGIEEDVGGLKSAIAGIDNEINTYGQSKPRTLKIGSINKDTGVDNTFNGTVMTQYIQNLYDLSEHDRLLLLNNSWRVRLYWYDNNAYGSSYYLGYKDYFAVSDVNIDILRETESTGYVSARFFGIVFFRYDGENIYGNVPVTNEELESFDENYKICEVTSVKELPSARSLNVLLAASDSPENYKSIADYVCTGTNDELMIQTALDDAVSKKRELVLAPGNYYIDEFYPPDHAGDGYHAIWLKNTTTQHTIIIRGIEKPSRKYGTANDLDVGPILRVTDNCYNSLDAATNYAVICGNGSTYNVRKYPWLDVDISNIGIVIPDNQRKIIGLDMFYATRASISNVLLICSGAVTTPKNGVVGCIGVRGLCGSAFGIGQEWKHSFVWGFHTGFAVAGEHLVCVELGTRYCDYGYRFNDFQTMTDSPTWLHPITMINCCDEGDFNYPYFGQSGDMRQHDGSPGKQTINLIDFNFEFLPEYFALGGNYATEESPGCCYANITFTTQVGYGPNKKNRVDYPFWAPGYGGNSRTVNMAHDLSGTTTLRKSYAANAHQQYYDTDLNKMLVYEGGQWVDFLGQVLD